jgi:hypothetical protein
MKLLFLLSFVFLSGCATKYIIPSNRFITPETQGDAFHGQVEIQQSVGNQLTIASENGESKVNYGEVQRTGFLLSNSFFDQFDLYWSHLGGANSMLGAKFQFVGAPRVGNGAGHKLAVAAAVGGNEHEPDDKTIEFELSGKEFLLLYGYRFNEMILVYSNLSYATYKFEGRVLRGPLVGFEPKLQNKVYSGSAGLELSYSAFFGKLEFTYQQLQTTDAKDVGRYSFGYSFGLNW